MSQTYLFIYFLLVLPENFQNVSSLVKFALNLFYIFHQATIAEDQLSDARGVSSIEETV